MNPSQIRKSSLSVAIASIVATTAVAQEAPNTQPTLMNQVTVTATRTERELDDVASSVSVVTAEDAEQNMVTNIRDLVKYEPGIDVTSDSRFGLGSFNVRGMDQNRVKITVDGVDQAKSFGYDKFIQSQRNFFDIENMKQLEVVKGPASTLHGSDAIGGVVAFVTKDPADYLKPEGDDSYASVKAGYNSADSSFNESFTLANRSGDWESMLIYTRRDGKERQSYGGRSGVGQQREKQDPLNYYSNSLLGKIQYQVNDDHRIGFTGEYQNSKSTSDQLSMQGENINGRVTYNSSSSNDRAERMRLGFFHEWQADLVAFDDVKWTFDWQNSKSHQKTDDDVTNMEIGGWIPGPGGDAPDEIPVPKYARYERHKDYVYEETSLQLNADFTKALESESASHFISYGVSIERKEQDNLNKTHYLSSEKVDGPGSGLCIPSWPINHDCDPDYAAGDVVVGRYAPVAQTNQIGLYLQDEIGLINDRLVVTPGIRYDRFESKIKSTRNYTGNVSDSKHDSFTARLGAVYEINDTWSAFGQYSQGFSTPDLFALYFHEQQPGLVEVLPNPDLKPEESDSIEFGLRANNELGSMEVTAFYNQYKNFIEQVTVDNPEGLLGGVFQYQNISEATIKGVEFKGMLWLDELLGAPVGTRFNTAIAWSEGRGKNDGGRTEPLNSVAPLKGVFGLGYDAPTNDWGSEVTWTLVSKKKYRDISGSDSDTSMDDRESGQFATSGYGLVDLTAYYKPHKDVTVSAGLFNITDKKYWVWDDVRGLSNSYEGIGRYTQPGRNYSVSVKWEI